jgi:hypothetical protein
MKQIHRCNLVYKFECQDGRRYIVYNASAIGNPGDHVPDKWYARPYPVPVPLDEDLGEPCDSAEEAEAAAMSRHARIEDAAKSAWGGAP